MPRARTRVTDSSNPFRILSVRVIPRASRIAIQSTAENQYKVYLTSAPVDGEANRQLIDVLANEFSVPRRQVEIISGERARIKRVRIITRSAGEPPAHR